MVTIEYLIFGIGTSPIWGTLLLHIRDCFIRPRFVHKADIALLAARLTATHGPRAEEQAAIEEDYCWRRGDMLQQAVWKRVRQELR